MLINPHAVIGYPEGLQSAPVRLRLAYPATWTVGTALHRGPDGVFVADSYDQLVDSPILLGRLSKARLVVTGVPIDVFAYSATDKIKASQLLSAMSGMLTAAGQFLGRLPVDHYTFLYHFEAGRRGRLGALVQLGVRAAGGRIHRLRGPSGHRHRRPRVLSRRDPAQHPQRDHRALQLRDAGAVAAPLALRGHHRVGRAHDAAPARAQDAGGVPRRPRSGRCGSTARRSTPRYSLRELALTSYSDSGQAQYGNIYMRGAVTAGLLDIRLLELSQGGRGCRI